MKYRQESFPSFLFSTNQRQNYNQSILLGIALINTKDQISYLNKQLPWPSITATFPPLLVLFNSVNAIVSKHFIAIYIHSRTIKRPNLYSKQNSYIFNLKKTGIKER